MNKTLILALGACLATPAWSQLIVGNDQGTNNKIYHINVNTGVSTMIVDTAGDQVWGLTCDDVNNRLYWNNGGTLKWASYASINAGAPVVNSLTMSQNYVSLGFNNATGKLYGTRNISTEAVYEIDTVTGGATNVFTYNSAFDFGGLDFDSTTGKLYGLADAAPTGSTRGLYEIDIVAQTATFKVAYPAGDTDIDGLAVNNGVAYYVNDAVGQLHYAYDIATGTQIRTYTNPMTGSGIFSGGGYTTEIVPEPASMLALGTALLALLRRRKG